MSESVHLMDPSGQIVEAPADGLASLRALGYTPATPEQIADFQATEKYSTGGQQVIAGLEGVGRGLSARLSTAAEVGLGVPPEDIEGRMAANPGTATVSEGVGVALPLLATLGAAAPAEAAGSGALRGAAGFTAPVAIARAGQAVGSRAAGGAIEGGLWGLGNVVHEAALGDPNLTAQGAFATVGLSAALGGGLGGLIGVAEPALKTAVGRAKTAIGDLADGLATPEKLKALAQEQHDAVNNALRLANKTIRPAEIAATLTTPPEVAQQEMDRIAGRIGEVAANMRAQPELFPPMFAAKLEQIAGGVTRNGVEGLDAAQAFTALNDAKQTLDKQLSKWGSFISPEHQDAVGAIRGIRTEIKTALENESVWGPAGARQAAFNEAQADYFNAQKDFAKEFMIKKPGKGVRPDYSMDSGKLARLSDTSNPRYPVRQEVWDNYQAAAKNLLGEIETSSAHAPVTGFDKDALESLINKSGKMEQGARQQGAVLRMLGRLGGIGPTSTMVGGLVGGAPGAIIGGVADAVIKGSKYIPRAVDALSHLHANNEAISEAIGSAAAKLASGAAKIGRGEVAAGIPHTFAMDAEDATAHFNKHAEKIRGFAANPENMQSALEEMTGGLHEHAPHTAQALSVTASRAVSFLASKLPPTIRPGPLAEELPISQSQIAVYNRYREAVEHPTSVLRQAAAGTLTPEAVEALQAVYPQLYQQIQGAVMEKMTPDVPHKTKLMAAILLGRDLDGTMSGQAILREQMRYVKPAPQALPTKPTKSGAAKLKGFGRAQTNSQRAAGGSK